MKKEEKENIEETIQIFGLASTINPLIAVFTGIRDAILRIESDRFAAEALKYNLEESWKTIYEVVVNIQLQGDEVTGIHDYLLKFFIMWCYDIENLLDKLELEILDRKDASTFVMAWEQTLDCIKQIFNPDKMGILQKRLKETEATWKDFLKKQTTIKRYHDPYLEGVKIFGRENEINEIVDKLLSCESKITGVSIIGGCGLGKSSLAQMIIDDRRIKEKFHFKKSIKVEDGEFVWDNIKKEFDECFGVFPATKVAFEMGDGHKATKLLIIFDNLMHIFDIEWDRFWAYTKKCGFKSVKVIITTHDPRISGKTGTAPYYLQPLSDSQCEEVIKENAKPYIDESKLSKHSFLYTISDVAKKCEGLPWIAQRLGNILGKRSDKHRKALQETARLWQTEEFQAEFFPKLASCYKDMNPKLRRCFSYLSLFPPNHHFNSDELVRLWVAECFTKSNKTGEKYVDDLKRRSILQSVDEQEYSKLQSFGHDFAMLNALGTCLHLDKVSSLSFLNENIRHLSFSCKLDQDSLLQLKHLRLRTFLSMYANNTDSITDSMQTISNDMKDSLLDVRVLSLRNSAFNKLPDFIKDLKHLRYLDVSWTQLQVLPIELQKLTALETLKVKGALLCGWRHMLHNLTNLRYIDWEQRDLQDGIPCQIGKLTLLESLPLFLVGMTDGCSITELKEMNKLKGSLWIKDLQNVQDEQQAKDAMLRNKHELRTIKLEWGSTDKDPSLPEEEHEQNECNHHTSVLRGLEAGDNLRELVIIKYKGEHLPEWIINSEIEKIHLSECCHLKLPEFVPALGKMRNLKTLILEDMKKIEQLSCRSNSDADTNACFPELESLELYNMTKLVLWEGLTGDENIMPRLRQLKVVACFSADLLVQNVKIDRPSVQIIYQPCFIQIDEDSDED